MTPRRGHGHVRPVERFLGAEHAGGGPFALLGVTPQACSEDLVLAALDRQIEVVAAHPECDTPEADEVRLALHAAAAQLLDPVVRRHLIARWTRERSPAKAAVSVGAVNAAPVAAAGAARAPARSGRSHAMRLLEHDAILTLAMCGGWNARALRRLISLAHARGMNNDQVVEALRGLSNRRRSLAPGPGGTNLARNGAPVAQLPIANTFTPGTTTGYPGVLRHEQSAAAAIPTPAVKPRVRETGGAQAAPAKPAQARGAARDNRPLEEEIDPAKQLLKRAALLGGIGLLTLVSLLVLVYLLTMPSKAPGSAPVKPGPPASSAPASAGGSATSRPPEVARREAPPAAAPRPATSANQRTTISPADPILLVREVASLAGAIEVSPEDAAKRFQEVVPKLAAAWPSLPKDRLVAVNDAILEYIYRVSGSGDLLMRGIDAVAAGSRPLAGSSLLQPGQVLPASWSSGMLLRLSRERDLSATAKLFIDRELAGALGAARPSIEQTFESGVLAAMYLIPQRLTPDISRGARPDAAVDLEVWKEFLRAAQSTPGADAALRQRVMLMGLETLLVNGPESNVNRTVAPVVGEIVSRLSWRAEDEPRRWLLRWFADQRISNADLNAVTSVLATRSAAEGIDVTMVLSTSAAASVRADLRERYATVWSLEEAVSRDQLVADWLQAARRAIADSYLAADDIGELASAAVLARLNEAANWHWRGDSSEASHLLLALHLPVEQALADSGQAPSGRIRTDLGDGAWAERYLAARQNIKFRRELLTELEGRPEIGMIDAEVLVREAMLGGPAEIRSRAQDVAKHFATSGALINAVLESLPRAPQIPATSNFVEAIAGASLPSVRDGDWGMRARRILVERLLEAIAQESPMARIDRLGRVLRVSYRSMAAQAPLSGSERDEELQPAAAVSGGQVWRAWRAAADKSVPTMAAPMSLDQIDRRRAGRQGQAKGMVQEFAAEQASLAELLGYVVAAEQPARVEEIRLILSDLASQRRRAKHIHRQMNATERAMAQLWLIRLGQPLAEGDS